MLGLLEEAHFCFLSRAYTAESSSSFEPKMASLSLSSWLNVWLYNTGDNTRAQINLCVRPVDNFHVRTYLFSSFRCKYCVCCTITHVLISLSSETSEREMSYYSSSGPTQTRVFCFVCF